MTTTVVEVLWKALAKWDVQRAFGVSGDAIFPLLDALGKEPSIQYIGAVSEAGAAFMAGGEARVTGRLGLCVATSGPGAVNLANGVADAYRDGIPLLVITGQVETAKMATAAKQYIDQQQLFAPITGMTVMLTRPESTVDVLKAAMEKAIGDSVPCQISIPQDIQSSPVPLSPVQSSPTAKMIDIPLLTAPSPPGITGDLEQAARLIDGARRPVLIAGRAALPFRDRVLALAEKVNAAIIPAQGARGIFPAMERRFIGGLGEAHIPGPLQQADMVLLIGASPFEHKYIPASIPVVQIEMSPHRLAHSLRPYPLTGDVGRILRQLSDAVRQSAPESGWIREIEQAHEDFLTMIRDEASGEKGTDINPPLVVSLINDLLPDDAIIAVDTGEFMHWFDRGFLPKAQQVLISEYWRPMGAGLPFGIGAQAAAPGKKVVVLTGDGGMNIALPEMITAVRHRLPVVSIVFHDSEYALEKHRMQKQGMLPVGADITTPDYAAVAAACGAEGILVKEKSQLPGALAKALAASTHQPVVVDIVMKSLRPAFL
ncbi:hypothetical protein GTO91_13875 [Heliobacterium undosum]|uniref:Thiamine pyrophosphate-binding protein n=1 Tax=Heliomicrobium undosum TaxID=121734 RepID=A0A845L2I8_9FIRM|nr:thiamine pyrophosphate-binding protein [Heliomicrobium undosum]MZP30802.1 hypothetical protein [Heliomicrobium undosum]